MQMNRKKDMNKIMREELMKIRRHPYWVWNRFVTPEKLDDVKQELRYSRRRYKTEEVYDNNGILKGYNIFTM